MGLITRQELAPALRQELDDVKNYIDGSNNEAMGEHMNDKNNPHNVTKEQVGLGNISNSLQGDFEAHVAERNPHGTTAEDVGAVPVGRSITAGTGLSGGGQLTTSRSLSLDLNYTDNRYLRRSGGSVTGNVTFERSITASTINTRDVVQDGDNAYFYIRVLSGGEARVTRKGGSYNTFENMRAKAFLNAQGQVAYHKGSGIRWGTSNPSGGSHGDIYIQY